MTAKELYVMIAKTIIQLMEWLIKCVEEETFINLVIEGGVVRELEPGEQPGPEPIPEPDPNPWLYKIHMRGNMNVYKGPSMGSLNNGYAFKGTVEYVYAEKNGMLRLTSDNSPSPRWIVDNGQWVKKEQRQ